MRRIGVLVNVGVSDRCRGGCGAAS